MMRLNVEKIDERIKKLQELRRLASDPELAAMLSDFIASEEEQNSITAHPPIGDPGDDLSHSDQTDELIHEALAADPKPGGSVWGIRRR